MIGRRTHKNGKPGKRKGVLLDDLDVSKYRMLLDAERISPSMIALQLEMTRPHVSAVLNGRQRCSRETARKLTAILEQEWKIMHSVGTHVQKQLPQ